MYNKWDVNSAAGHITLSPVANKCRKLLAKTLKRGVILEKQQARASFGNF